MIKFLISFFCASVALSAGPIPDFPFIAVSEDTEKNVAPDRATIFFTVMNHQVKSEDAVKNVDNILRKLIDELGKLGVKADHLSAGDLDKSAVRRRTKDYKQLEILGYDVRRGVEVKIVDLKIYPAVARKIFATDGVTRINSSFTHSKEDEIRFDLLASACAKARGKAERLAQAAGVKIKRVHAVSDRSLGGLGERFGIDGSYESAGGGLLPMASASRAGGNEPPIFVPKEITLGTSVNLLFQLEN